jgi:hypothetical protein
MSEARTVVYVDAPDGGMVPLTTDTWPRCGCGAPMVLWLRDSPTCATCEDIAYRQRSAPWRRWETWL